MLALCCAAVGGCRDVIRLPNGNQHQYEDGYDPLLAFKQVHNMNKMIISTSSVKFPSDLDQKKKCKSRQII